MSNDFRASIPVMDASEERDTSILCYPLEAWFVSSIVGYAQTIAKDIAWSGSTEQVGSAANDVQRMIVSLSEGTCCLDDLEFRVVDCGLQWRLSPTASWEDAAGNTCGATGAQGIQGIQGIPGETDVINVIPLNPDWEENVAQCNTAWYMSEYLFEKWNDTIDQVEAVADLASVIDGIFMAFPLVYLIADQVMDAVNEVIEAGVNTCRAWDTVEQREAQAKAIYCVLQEDGTLTEDGWETYQSQVLDPELPIGALAYGAYINAFSYQGANAQANQGTYNTAETCVGWTCFDWEHTFDFTDEQGDWFIISGRGGEYTALTGFTCTDLDRFDPPNAWVREVTPQVNFDDTLINYIMATLGNVVVPTEEEAFFQLWYIIDGVTWELAFDTSKPVNGETGGTTPDKEDVTGVAIACIVDRADTEGNLAGSATISKVVLRGKGTNPFL